MTTIIAISGLEGSGKTALMMMLAKKLDNVQIVHYNRYKPEITYNQHFDWLVTSDHNYQLADFTTLKNVIKDLVEVDQPDYLLVDYPYGHTQQDVSLLLDYVFYIDTSLDILYTRHLLNNYSVTTTTDEILSDVHYYTEYARDFLELEREKIKSSANLVVDGDREMVTKVQYVLDYLACESLDNQQTIWQEIARNLPERQTERLILRKFAYSDAENILAYASNPLVTEKMTWSGLEDLADSQMYIQDSLTNSQLKEPLIWAIALKESNQVIGALSLAIETGKKHGEIGYLLNPDYWHLGYATEAVNQLLDFSFKELKLLRLYGLCLTDNPSSTKVMLNCGMLYEGTLRNYVRIKGKLKDVNLYSKIVS